MIVLNVFLSVEPSQKEQVLTLLADVATKSQQEAGNHYYDYFSRDNQFIIVSYWKDQAALDTHNQSDHLNEFISKLLPLLTAPLQRETYITH